jgi:hypothetical protein
VAKSRAVTLTAPRERAVNRASEIKRSTRLGSSVASASDAAVTAAAVSGKYGGRRADGPNCGCGRGSGGGMAEAGIGSGGKGGMVCGAQHARALGALGFVDMAEGGTAGAVTEGVNAEGTAEGCGGGMDMDGMDGGDAGGISSDSSGAATVSAGTALLRATGGTGDDEFNGGKQTGWRVGSGGDDPALSSPPNPHWLGALLRGGGTRRHWRMCAAKSACASSPPSAIKRFCGWQRYGLWSP